MRKLALFFALAAPVMGPAPVIAADFETGEYYVDHVSCLALAREEGRLIIKISALHPVIKHDRHGAVAAHVKELKIDKRTVHHESRRVECI